MRKALLACSAALALSGCYSFRGPAPAVDAYGVVPHDNFNWRQGPLYQRFIAATALASGCTINPKEQPERTGRTAHASRPDVDCPEERIPGAEREARMFAPDSAEQRRRMANFMRSGYALVRADCFNYFAVMGRNQARSPIARATIGPVLNLISGVLSLRNVDMSEGSDAITITTLASATATSGLDIFDQNFLFGSDNIAIVEELAINSMGAHAERTLSGPNTASSFEEASSNIIQHQALCRPAGILRLVRSSIQNATPRVNQTDARAATAPRDAAAPEGPVNTQGRQTLPSTTVTPSR